MNPDTVDRANLLYKQAFHWLEIALKDPNISK